MNPITVFQLASWTIGLWDYWLVGIEAGAGPITVYSCVVRMHDSLIAFGESHIDSNLPKRLK